MQSTCGTMYVYIVTYVATHTTADFSSGTSALEVFRAIVGRPSSHQLIRGLACEIGCCCADTRRLQEPRRINGGGRRVVSRLRRRAERVYTD